MESLVGSSSSINDVVTYRCEDLTEILSRTSNSDPKPGRPTTRLFTLFADSEPLETPEVYMFKVSFRNEVTFSGKEISYALDAEIDQTCVTTWSFESVDPLNPANFLQILRQRAQNIEDPPDIPIYVPIKPPTTQPKLKSEKKQTQVTSEEKIPAMIIPAIDPIVPEQDEEAFAYDTQLDNHKMVEQVATRDPNFVAGPPKAPKRVNPLLVPPPAPTTSKITGRSASPPVAHHQPNYPTGQAR